MRRPLIALALLLTLALGAPALASHLPFGFMLGKVAETWTGQKAGVVVSWEVQRYRGGEPVGAPVPGKLALKGGRYRAQAGEGDGRVVRVFDNTAGGALTDGRFARMAPETIASLPEGIFLRSRDSLKALLSSYGIDPEVASLGRMTSEDPEIQFHTVVRYGAPAGADDLSVPQVWIEPHRFTIHRVVALEAGKPLVVDYTGHGTLGADWPWLPAGISVSLGGQRLWTARLTEVTGAAPSDKAFSLDALEAEAGR